MCGFMSPSIVSCMISLNVSLDSQKTLSSARGGERLSGRCAARRQVVTTVAPLLPPSPDDDQQCRQTTCPRAWASPPLGRSADRRASTPAQDDPRLLLHVFIEVFLSLGDRAVELARLCGHAGEAD